MEGVEDNSYLEAWKGRERSREPQTYLFAVCDVQTFQKNSPKENDSPNRFSNTHGASWFQVEEELL